MATGKYQIGSAPNGGILWSDGSVTYPNQVTPMMMPVPGVTPPPQQYKTNYNVSQAMQGNAGISYNRSLPTAQKAYPGVSFKPATTNLPTIKGTSTFKPYSSPTTSSPTPTNNLMSSMPSKPISPAYYDQLKNQMDINSVNLPSGSGLNFSDLINNLTATSATGSYTPQSLSSKLSLPNQMSSFQPNFSKLLGAEQTSSTKGVGNKSSNPTGYTINSSGDFAMKIPGLEKVDPTKLQSINSDVEKRNADVQALIEKAANSSDPNVALNELYDQIWGLENEANTANEGDLQAIFDAQKQLLENQYSNYIGEANALIPEYEADQEAAIKKQNDALAKAKLTGTQAKESLLNKQGTDINSIWKNRNASQQKMSNIYSALGTTESSDFLNRANQLEATAGSEAASTERFYGGEISKVDQKLLDLETTTKDQVAEIMRTTQAQIDKIRRYGLYSEEEKAAKIAELVANFASDLTNLKSTHMNNQGQLLAQRANILEQQAIIQTQGEQQRSLLDYANNLQSQIPAVDQSDIDTIGRSSNPTASARLKSKYPGLSDLIDSVMNGTATPDQLITAIKNQTSTADFANLINSGQLNNIGNFSS